MQKAVSVPSRIVYHSLMERYSNFDFRDHLSRTANFIVADLGTLEILLRSPESAMGQMFCGTHSLEIVLISSIDTFFATELQCMGETNHPHVLHEAAIREADIWVRLGLMLSRLPSLSRVKVWFDHDSEEYWWNVNEPAILHPLLDLANRSGTQVTVIFPSHAFDDISIPPFHIERRPRQTYHVTGLFSYGCINHKWQYPVLRGFAHSVVTDEDVGPEIEAIELKMWQDGEDRVIVLESVCQIVSTHVLQLVSSTDTDFSSGLTDLDSLSGFPGYLQVTFRLLCGLGQDQKLGSAFCVLRSARVHAVRKKRCKRKPRLPCVASEGKKLLFS
jgi:hypothetical protein